MTILRGDHTARYGTKHRTDTATAPHCPVLLDAARLGTSMVRVAPWPGTPPGRGPGTVGCRLRSGSAPLATPKHEGGRATGNPPPPGSRHRHRVAHLGPRHWPGTAPQADRSESSPWWMDRGWTEVGWPCHPAVLQRRADPDTDSRPAGVPTGREARPRNGADCGI